MTGTNDASHRDLSRSAFDHLWMHFTRMSSYEKWNGLYCRADDRGDPVVQLAPPLISNQETFDEIEQILRATLTEAWTRL